MRKIILIGYMGVGKTTIAQLLAETRNQKWVDLDHLIEKKEQLSVAELFKHKGEIYFRKIEHELFENVLKNQQDSIISTGGGTPCYANNHLLLQGDKVISIYLQASLDFIFERLKKERANRPLIADHTEEELKDFMAKNLFERSYFYNQATYKINVDGKTPETLVDEILQLLQ